MDILRIRVPEFSKTNTVSRIKNILTYFFGVMIATFKVGKQDYIFSISQRLFLEDFLECRGSGWNVMINNWIDEKEIYSVEAEYPRVVAFKEKYRLQHKFVIMYSGNVGLYYDLENIMKVIKEVKPGTKTADSREISFAFVGAGSVLDKLVMFTGV